jgi:tetratricopeptide (TPR) repeat protein
MADDFVLTPEELAQLKRKRRAIAIIIVCLVMLGIAGVFAAPHIRDAIRGMQARRHAQRAFTLIDQQKWREARDEATAAYQLRPNEPQALRAVARLLSRAGQADALGFWKNLAAITPLTRQDLRDEAEVALRTNDLAAAHEAVEHLLQNFDGNPGAVDFIYGAQVAARKRQFDKATELTQQALADAGATRHEKLRANLTLAEVIQNSGDNRSSALHDLDVRLFETVKGDDQDALDATVALSQRFLNAQSDEKNSFPISLDHLAKTIEAHPLAKPVQKLLAADLEIAAHPDQREQIETRTIEQWQSGNNDELAALGAWLYRRGEYQRELDAIPLERATQTRDLFLQHVDALGALGRWDEIRRILENERFPLDAVIQHMYLARCFAQQGEKNGADNNWQRAVEDAAGDPAKLMMLADYAEKNGAHDVALTAYNAAVAVQPKSRPAQLGRLRAIYASGDTKKIHEVVSDLLKIWPNDSGLLNDQAYVRLLLLPPDTKPDAPELRSIEALAEKLVQEEPASLPHRTLLALALLKENRAYTALGLYRGITVPPNAVSPSTGAVHAAVLAASGQVEPAKSEAEKIPADKLLPEERQLIANL